MRVDTKELWDWVCKPENYELCTYTYTPVKLVSLTIMAGTGYEEYKIKKRYQKKALEMIYDKCESQIYYWECPEEVVSEIVKKYAEKT
jgi:hypothetical protein